MTNSSRGDTDRETFRDLVDAIEDAGFVITHERFKSDREDEEFQAAFWILSHRQEPDGGTIERPWLEADTLRESIELLRDAAASVEGEPCDAWYARQLEQILESTAPTDSGNTMEPLPEEMKETETERR